MRCLVLPGADVPVLPANSGVELIRGDLRDPQAVRTFCRNSEGATLLRCAGKAKILNAVGSNLPPWIVHFPGRGDMEHQAPEIAEYIAGHYRREAVLPWTAGEVWLLKYSP